MFEWTDSDNYEEKWKKDEEHSVVSLVNHTDTKKKTSGTTIKEIEKAIITNMMENYSMDITKKTKIHKVDFKKSKKYK